MQSAGDQRFKTMTMSHANALFQTALRLTENRAAAVEIVHEAYACAWKSFNGHAESSEGRVGLFKILIQQIHRRNRGWFSAPWLPEQDHTSEGCPGAPADSDTFSPEQVVSALSRVPVVSREIILLIDCQEFSYKEAAEILVLSTDVVADRLIVARKQLRSELATALSRDVAVRC
ncbi:MAG: hypothetical protein DMG13_05595 [Acidobacteria bacterium]|nr:MAG: hypothetical protein DMG13_05595 [Acidobacteriota bacterium]